MINGLFCFLITSSMISGLRTSCKFSLISAIFSSALRDSAILAQLQIGKHGGRLQLRVSGNLHLCYDRREDDDCATLTQVYSIGTSRLPSKPAFPPKWCQALRITDTNARPRLSPRRPILSKHSQPRCFQTLMLPPEHDNPYYMSSHSIFL